MDTSRFNSWPRWASFLALCPIALAAHQFGSMLLLPILVCALVVMLLLAVRSKGWPRRLMAIDVLTLLLVGSIAIYHTSMGETTSLELALILAPVLVLGSIAFAWFLEEDASPSGRPGWLALHWNRALAFAILTLSLTLVISIWAFGPTPRVMTYSWLASSFSFWPLLLLTFACVLPGPVGTIVSLIALAILEVALVWHIASTEVVVFQDHPLLWEELVSRVRDPGSWDILVEGLLSFQAALLTLVLFGGLPALAKVLGKMRRQSSFLVLLRILALVLVCGSLFVRQAISISPTLAERYLANSSAPWSSVHDRDFQPRVIDWNVAEQVRTHFEPPIWEPVAAPPLDTLAGRYRGRSIVFLLLESQSPTNVAGLGEGAYAHKPSAPYLTRLMKEGLFFTNYIASGFDTRSAMWTVLTGLPLPMGDPAGVQRGPEAARVGRMPDFLALGYRCDWLYAGSPRFDNWDLLMQGAGVRWWIDAAESLNLPRDYWTSWGMPDEALHTIALERYRQALKETQSTFIGVLTVSNHTPYSFPDMVDGQRLSKDQFGGTRYADYAMNELIEQLRSLPEQDRPIIVVTADTSFIENLREIEPWGILALEGLRIPGLILLPDGYLAGERYEGLFSHEDVLDLLYMLVAPEEKTRGGKFRAYRRAVAFANSYQVLTRNSYFASPKHWFQIEGYWSLRETEAPPERSLIEKAWEQHRKVDDKLWPTESEPGPLPSD
ncbi:MAG: monovalent cation/H+ antiporter complex subunit F [Vicinamibacteria bacterium]